MQYGQISDRIGDALRRRFNVGPDFQLSLTPEISGVVPFDTPEALYHAGWRRWQRASDIGAVAGVVGRSQLRVRDASNSLVVVEKVIVSSSSTNQCSGDFGYGPNALDLVTADSAMEFRDGRQTPSAGTGVVAISHDTNAAATTTAFDFFMVANTPYEVPGAPWVLLPGNQMLINSNVVNTTLLVTWVWRERPLNDSEVSP